MRIALATLVAAVLVGGILVLLGGPFGGNGARGETLREDASGEASREGKAPPLELVVRDSEGAPLQGAYVVIVSEDGDIDRSVTGPEGEVRMGGHWGRGEVCVWHESVPPHRSELQLQGRRAVRLGAGEVVAGRIVVDDSIPEASIEVELHCNSQLAGQEIFPREVWAQLPVSMSSFRVLRTWTDERGAFRFTGLPATWSGRVELPDPYAPRLPGQARSLANRYDPSSRSVLRPRQDILLKLELPCEVIGRVVDSEGSPLAEVLVSCRTEGSSSYTQKWRADEGGRFRGLVRPSTTQAIRLRVEDEELELAAEVRLPRPPISDGVWDVGDLRARRPLTVDVQVVDDLGAPLRGARASAVGDKAPGLPGWGPLYDRLGPVSRATDGEGNTRVEIPAGTTHLAVARDGYEAVLVAIEEPPILPIRARLFRPARLDIELDLPGAVSSEGAQLRLELESEGPIDAMSPSTVFDVSSHLQRRLDRIRILEPAQRGALSQGWLQSGHPLRLRVLDRLQHLVHTEEISPLQPGEVRSHVVAVPQPLSAIRLAVVDQDGLPVSDAMVQLDRRWGSRTDELGYFDLEDLAATSFRLDVEKDGFYTFREDKFWVPHVADRHLVTLHHRTE